MCPACVASTAVMVAGAGSAAGGILAVCIGKFRKFFRGRGLIHRWRDERLPKGARFASESLDADTGSGPFSLKMTHYRSVSENKGEMIWQQAERETRSTRKGISR
jgi:hypothetical protein